jgi:hypothetical protein
MSAETSDSSQKPTLVIPDSLSSKSQYLQIAKNVCVYPLAYPLHRMNDAALINTGKEVHQWIWEVSL